MNHAPIFAPHFARRTVEPPWQWAAREIDYSRAANYDTPYRGKFDPDLMPFCKEPLEMAHDPAVREIVILKCSRAGFSEGIVLTDQRYTVACAPEPSLYVTGKMDLAKGFLDRRVIRGMRLAGVLDAKMAAARTVAQDIQFAEMDFRATWASSDTAVKQDGWARIWADEVSLWDEFTVDMLRRRCAAYPFHHIVFGGSIDPTRRGNPEEDPTLKLYNESDRRVWVMPDPSTGNEFAWSLDGIKWPAEAHDGDDWDLPLVARESYFETPDGTRIDEVDRMTVARAGRWMARGVDSVRVGYMIVAPMVPFADCAFGSLATRFLSAKHRLNLTAKKDERQRNTIRTYFAENWAEAKRDEEIVVRDDTLADREADYEQGGVYVQDGLKHLLFLSVDVQKYHFWWLLHQWAYNDDLTEVTTAMVDFGNAPTFDDLSAIAGESDCMLMGLDIQGNKYRIRETQVYCSQCTDPADVHSSRTIALRGMDSDRAKIPVAAHIEDAWEGGASKDRDVTCPYLCLQWDTDIFRTMACDSMSGMPGVQFHVPKQRSNEAAYRAQYIKQVTSTRKLDNEWEVAGHGQDHLFDCTVMQFVLAHHAGLLINV